MVDPANFQFLQKTTLFCQNQYSPNKQTSLKTEYNLTPLISIFFVKCGLEYPAKKGAKNKKRKKSTLYFDEKRW
jgi:hypothetical protein